VRKEESRFEAALLVAVKGEDRQAFCARVLQVVDGSMVEVAGGDVVEVRDLELGNITFVPKKRIRCRNPAAPRRPARPPDRGAGARGRPGLKQGGGDSAPGGVTALQEDLLMALACAGGSELEQDCAAKVDALRAALSGLSADTEVELGAARREADVLYGGGPAPWGSGSPWSSSPSLWPFTATSSWPTASTTC
jgi:hypothetical protein